MIKTFNQKQSRMLALGILILALLAVVALVATPVFLLHRHYDQELEDLEDRLDRYQRLAASRDQLTRRLTQLRALDGKRFYLKNSAPAVAAGEIQELEKALIEKNGGRLASMQIQPHKDEGPFRRVAVIVQMLGGIGTVQNVLRALESNEPYLFVDNLNVRSLSSSATPEAATADGGLVVQFDLIGYGIHN